MAEGDNVGTHGQSFFGYVGLGFEPDGQYASATDPTVFSDVVSEDFSGDNGTLFNSTIRTRSRFYGNAGPFEDSGSVEMAAAPENGLGYLLKGCLGSSSVTTQDPGGTGSPTVGIHEFTSAPLLPSLTAELGLADINAVQHVGCGVDTLELEHAAEEYLTATFEMIAKKPVLQDQRSTPTYSDLRPFVYHDGSFQFDGETRTSDVQETTVSVENDLEGQYRGERSIEFMNVGERTVEDEVTLDFTNDDLWRKFLGGSQASEPQKQLFEGSLSATWVSPETIADTNTNYQLDVEMPRVVLNSREASMSEVEQVAEDITYAALLDESLGYDIKFTLTNGRTSAY